MPDIAFEQLPKPVQAVFAGILEPAYERLAVAAADPLERSAASTAVFLLGLELLDHFAMAKLFDFNAPPNASGAEEREKLIDRHRRVVAAKQRATGFLSRLQQQRLGRGPFA
jgi:hypothetical protein